MLTLDSQAAAAHRRSAAAPLVRAIKGDADFPDERAVLHDSCICVVTRVSRSAPNAPKNGRTTAWGVALPLAGVFTWEVGRSISIIDPNSALFISGGQTFSETHPVSGRGHAAVIAVPSREVLDELCRGRSPDDVPLFQTAAHMASPRAQMIARQLCRDSYMAGALERDELTLAFLEETFDGYAPTLTSAPQRIAQKAKEFLHAGSGAAPISLAGAAREIGVTPTYLTQAFKKSVGIPLYKYQIRLRLARALDELPSCESITDLALALGFSSHSHFSAAFSAHYRISPSQYRETMRAN